MSGRVVHFEVPADDVERAQGFYQEAFGWQVQTVPGFEYSSVTTTATDDQGRPAEAGAINGGMVPRQSPIDRPVITIEVADIEDALSKVESGGGSTVVPKEPVADMGFTAYFKDSEGNLMGMWQNA